MDPSSLARVLPWAHFAVACASSRKSGRILVIKKAATHVKASKRLCNFMGKLGFRLHIRAVMLAVASRGCSRAQCPKGHMACSCGLGYKQRLRSFFQQRHTQTTIVAEGCVPAGLVPKLLGNCQMGMAHVEARNSDN
jgi:hypothetical protein